MALKEAIERVLAEYSTAKKEALKTRAADFRTRLGKDTGSFTPHDLDLRPSSTTNYSADYEAGTVVGKFYSAGSIPDDEVLKEDLRVMLALYEALVYSVGES